MSTETLNWRLRIQDGASGPAGRAASGVRSFRAELSRLRRENRDFGASQRVAARQASATAREASSNARRVVAGQRAVSSSFRGMVGVLGGVAIGAGALLAGIAESFAGVGLAAAGAVVEVASFRESSLVALQAVLGSSEAAGRSFRNAITIANQTPLDTQDIIRQTSAFAIAGFSEREITPLIAASADLGAAFGQRSQEGFAYALAQIRAAGQLQGQELLQLQNANISREAVLASIARQMNLGTGDAGNRAALAAIRARRVSSGVGIQAALDAVQTRLDRGRSLGSFARDQSATLTGALSNARNAIFNLLVGIDFSKIPGVRAFKDALIAITDALSSGSPAAKSLRGFLEGAANAMGGLFGRIFTARNALAVLDMAGRAVRGIGAFAAFAGPLLRAFIGALGPNFLAGIAPLRTMFAAILSGGGPSATTMTLLLQVMRGLGAAIGFATGAVVTFLGTVATIATAVSGGMAAVVGLASSGAAMLRGAFVQVGTQIVDGIIAGITGGVARLGEAVAGLGTGAVSAARAALGIHSPSRVFADVIGRQIPAGIEVGMERGRGSLDASVAGIVEPSSPSRAFGARVDVGGIHLHFPAMPGASAEDIGDAVEERMLALFERFAESTG